MHDTLALVILSGGLDSATALGLAVEEYGAPNVRTISFKYGQKHSVELHAAAVLSDHYKVVQTIVELPKHLFKGGSLTGTENITDMRYDDLADGEMSPTYVPFRNGNMISMAAAFADSLIREDGIGWEKALLYCGMHSEDGAGFAYADCTPEFLGAMAAAVYVGTYQKVRLHALFQHMTKAQIISKGIWADVPYALTHSCYRGERPACGQCSTCHARLDAFEVVGIADPLEYA